jgi:hypothetical protein
VYAVQGAAVCRSPASRNEVTLRIGALRVEKGAFEDRSFIESHDVWIE